MQKTSPRSRVSWRSSCIESAATKRITGSPVGMAQVTGFSASRKAVSRSPLTRLGLMERFWRGDRSPSNCSSAGSTRENCSGLEIPYLIAVRGYLGTSPDSVSHGFSKSSSPSTCRNSPTMLGDREGYPPLAGTPLVSMNPKRNERHLLSSTIGT